MYSWQKQAKNGKTDQCIAHKNAPIDRGGEIFFLWLCGLSLLTSTLPILLDLFPPGFDELCVPVFYISTQVAPLSQDVISHVCKE